MKKEFIFYSKSCKFCGKNFTTEKKNKIFCSLKCGKKSFGQSYKTRNKSEIKDFYVEIVKKQIEKKIIPEKEGEEIIQKYLNPSHFYL